MRVVRSWKRSYNKVIKIVICLRIFINVYIKNIVTINIKVCVYLDNGIEENQFTNSLHRRENDKSRSPKFSRTEKV